MPKAKKTDKQRIYILDTNIFMADPDCMNRFGKHMIVVPDMVIEELDDNKKASGDKGYNTRQSLRNFDSLRRKGNLIKGCSHRKRWFYSYYIGLRSCYIAFRLER